MFEFHYQNGNNRRRLFQVKGEICSIGSARSNDLVVQNRRVGKRHAELHQRRDGIYLRDLGSATGSWVNRERVVDAGPLHELDEITIGDVHIVVDSSRAVFDDAPAIPSAVPPVMESGRSVAPDAKESTATSGEAARAAVADRDDVATGDTSSDLLAYWGRIVHERLIGEMDLRRKDVNRMSDQQLREESDLLINTIVSSLEEEFPEDLDRKALKQHVLDEAVGLGPLERLLVDKSVSEVMVNNHREIFLERDGKLVRSNFSFSSDATVRAVIDRIISPLGKRIDESSPIVDARLKDGSRVNAIIPPLALKGPSLTIRKFPEQRLSFADLVGYGSLSQEMVDFLKVCVERRCNIIVSGGTGSGKTTLLNVLSGFIPDSDRIVTIEDAAELRLAQPNLVSLESRPSNLEGKGSVTIRELVKNSLRMRPDRIIVGECRGGEALDMLQAMNTGHDGSLTTIHANNPRDVIARLEVLVLMAGMDLPVQAIREQVASAVNIIIQQTRFPCGSRRITRVTEVVGVESGTVQLHDLFVFRQRGVNENGRVVGQFQATGAIPMFFEELREMGIEVDLSLFTKAAAQQP
ncbi:MAG: hypothetical protein CSA54_04905 [Gammaproteobacteria bacterium]|nr:MAG: hypothetical protein CSA54_04905 [Gammaproteobacteria bacterium]